MFAKCSEILNQANLQLNLAKCHFAQTTLKILGNIVSPSGIQIDMSQAYLVVNGLKPETGQDVQSICGFYTIPRGHSQHCGSHLNRWTPSEISNASLLTPGPT